MTSIEERNRVLAGRQKTGDESFALAAMAFIGMIICYFLATYVMPIFGLLFTVCLIACGYYVLKGLAYTPAYSGDPNVPYQSKERNNVIPVMEHHSCPSCKGNGRCPYCRGTGKFNYYARQSPAMYTACTFCLGTGQCSTCNGTGRSRFY